MPSPGQPQRGLPAETGKPGDQQRHRHQHVANPRLDWIPQHREVHRELHHQRHRNQRADRRRRRGPGSRQDHGRGDGHEPHEIEQRGGGVGTNAQALTGPVDVDQPARDASRRGDLQADTSDRSMPCVSAASGSFTSRSTIGGGPPAHFVGPALWRVQRLAHQSMTGFGVGDAGLRRHQAASERSPPVRARIARTAAGSNRPQTAAASTSSPAAPRAPRRRRPRARRCPGLRTPEPRRDTERR